MDKGNPKDDALKILEDPVDKTKTARNIRRRKQRRLKMKKLLKEVGVEVASSIPREDQDATLTHPEEDDGEGEMQTPEGAAEVPMTETTPRAPTPVPPTPIREIALADYLQQLSLQQQDTSMDDLDAPLTDSTSSETTQDSQEALHTIEL